MFIQTFTMTCMIMCPFRQWVRKHPSLCADVQSRSQMARVNGL